MEASFIYILVCLLFGIAAIVFLTAKLRVHAFFAPVPVSFIVGLGVRMPACAVIIAIKEGFGNIMKSLAFIIVLGTTLGLVLEHTGSTRVMAGSILGLKPMLRIYTVASILMGITVMTGIYILSIFIK